MRIPFWRAMRILFLSTLAVTGSASIGLSYYNYLKWKRAHDDKYNIVAIVQSCQASESLKTVYLAELLGLSVDQPINLFQFDSRAAERKLLASPLIKSAKVRKISPGTLFIDYTPRSPCAYLADYTNTAIDREGVPLPFKPFFTPKNIPELYLGLEGEEGNEIWGKRLQGRKPKLALEILNFLNHSIDLKLFQVKRIDVSHAYASSYGQREVVITLYENGKESLAYPDPKKTNPSLSSNPDNARQHAWVLRLSSENYPQELANYYVFKKYYRSNAKSLTPSDFGIATIVDLRVPQLAFIKQE